MKPSTLAADSHVGKITLVCNHHIVNRRHKHSDHNKDQSHTPTSMACPTDTHANATDTLEPTCPTIIRIEKEGNTCTIAKSQADAAVASTNTVNAGDARTARIAALSAIINIGGIIRTCTTAKRHTAVGTCTVTSLAGGASRAHIVTCSTVIGVR